MSLFDCLFPKRCVGCRRIGSYVCTQCFSYISFIEHMVCAVCQKQTMGGYTHPVCRSRYGIDGVFSSLVYKGIVKKLVYTFKYPPYLTDLQPLLIDLFYEGLIQKEPFYKLLNTPTILIPIPLHKKRFRKRGYNQAKLLAQGLSDSFGFEVLDCLERIKETKTQVGLSKETRQANVKDAFALKKEASLDTRTTNQVFLIDDVATSGATMREAARVLKKAGIKHVWGITLSHGE